jgi:copper(I)-binding protein
MMTLNTVKTLFAAASIGLVALCTPAFAHDYTVGDIKIDHPYARATPPNANVAGGFMTIENMGAEADRLIGAESGLSERVEIHEMAMENDVMKMRALADGLELPAGATTELKPGGYHVMFLGLKQPLAEGESYPVTLVFEKAGKLEVELKIEGMAAKHGAGHGHGQMNHGDMKKDGMKHGDMKEKHKM